jgi:aryl-alcohol dehydrogenase-like predicted oxidoreductase
MEFRKLGRTGLKVSEICLGTALFGAPTDEDEAHRMLDLFLDRGGNFVDTADVYSAWDDDSWAGRSEEMIGTWLAASGKRHEIVLATKARSAMSDLPNDQGLSRRHLMDAVEASLRRLQTDFIDLYQTHSMDTDTPIEETMRALDDLVRQGKVRYVGCSNYSAWRLCQALWASDRADVVRYECLQPVYNLLQREGFERDTADLIREKGLAVIPYSPQAAGFLTGKYKAGQEPPPNTRAASNDRMRRHFTDANFELVEEIERIGQGHGKTVGHVALAWHLSNPLITAPILGARNAAQLEESLGAAGFRLQEEEMSRLNALTEWRQD